MRRPAPCTSPRDAFKQVANLRRVSGVRLSVQRERFGNPKFGFEQAEASGLESQATEAVSDPAAPRIETSFEVRGLWL